MTTGNPNPPLARTLSLRDGMRVWFHAMPEAIGDEIDEYALELTFVADPAKGIDAAHVFTADRAELAALLASLRYQLSGEGHLWISWPSAASALPTDITEDTIRELAVPLGYVDTKACAVDAVWDGLKLVIRKDLR